MADIRILPKDEQAEKAVCGALIVDGEVINDLRYILQPNDFFYTECRAIYESCINLYNRGEKINQITIARELVGMKQLEKVGGIAFLSHLVAECFSSLESVSYAHVIKNTSIARKIITMGHEISMLGYEETDPQKMVSVSEQKILEIQKEVAMPRLITPEDMARRGADYYTMLKQGKRKGVYFGFNQLDELLGGLFGGELCYLAGRPSSGKSDIALSIAEYVGQNFGNVLMVSLEQPWEEILDRFTARELKITPRHLRVGNYSDILFGEIIRYMGVIPEKRMYFYDSGGDIEGKGSTTNSIFSIANCMKLAYGLRLIIIDYIGLMEDEYREKLYERVTTISKKLKRLARTIDVPVLCLCQLNRETERRADHHPILSDLRESGSLEQDGDVILFAYRGEKYSDVVSKCTEQQREIFGINEITIAKHRQVGEVADAIAPLIWNYKERHYCDPNSSRVALEFEDKVLKCWVHSNIQLLPESFRPRSSAINMSAEDVERQFSERVASVPEQMK